MNNKFNFDEWTCTYKTRSKKDKTQWNYDTIYLKDIISIDDIFFIEGVGKPIIKKNGIGKIVTHFQFIEAECPISYHECPEPYKFLILANPKYYDQHQDIYFSGFGEASFPNLMDKNDFDRIKNDNIYNLSISAKYPAALAEKRGRSRAVLVYLAIDAYGEEESRQFAEGSSQTVTSKDIDLLPNEQKELLFNYGAKKALNEFRVKLMEQLNPPMNNSDFGTLLRNILSVDKGETISLKSLTIGDLIHSVCAMEIMRTLDNESLEKYLNSFHGQAEKEEELDEENSEIEASS